MTKSTTTKKAIDIIKEFEGYNFQAYPDPIKGWDVPTIGYGTTVYQNGKKVKAGDVLTQHQAVMELGAFITKKILPKMERIRYWDNMNSNQQAAVVCFAYNLGHNFYARKGFESITELLNCPDKWGGVLWVKRQFWKYTNGGMGGLVRRRDAEATLFLTKI